jgi:O-antigen ligase
MLVALGVSTANALDPRMALENSWHWIINLGIFVMLIDWFRRGYGGLLFGGAFASGGAVTGSSILQGLIMPGNRVSGLLGLVNLTGGYTAAQLVPVMGWASSVRGKKRWGLILLAASQLVTLYLNGSRGALISVGTAGLVVLLPFIIRKLKRGFLALPIMGLVIVGVGLWSADPMHSSGDVLRLDLWRAAGEMLQARTISGVGVGLFGQTYRNISPYLGRPDADGITGAHNLYLNLAAEMGTVGLLAGGSLLLMVGYLLTKTHWNLLKLSVLGALVGILAHMTVDNFPTQNFTLLVSLYVAYLVHDHRMRIPGLKHLGKAVGVSLVAFCFLLLYFDQAQTIYERSLVTGNVEEAKQAARLDSDLRLYHLNVLRLRYGLRGVMRVDPTIKPKTDLGLYALVSYGRYW